MIRLIIGIVIGISLMLLSGCVNGPLSSSVSASDSRFEISGEKTYNSLDVYVLKDRRTGNEYIITTCYNRSVTMMQVDNTSK